MMCELEEKKGVNAGAENFKESREKMVAQFDVVLSLFTMEFKLSVGRNCRIFTSCSCLRISIHDPAITFDVAEVGQSWKERHRIMFVEHLLWLCYFLDCI